VTLTGRVTTRSAGQDVAVLARRYGHSGLSRVATAVTRRGGYWSYRARPGIQTAYAVHFGANTSPTRVVGVQPAIRVDELGNGMLSVRVQAARSFGGRTVKLQRRTSGGAWETVAQHKLMPHSTAVFQTSLQSSTIRVAMSVNEAGAGYLGAASHPLRYHAYSLTLEPSSYRAVFGTAVTLSGRLVGAKGGKRVGIFKRQLGRSAPKKVGSVRTGADGVWSLSIKPAIQVSFWAQWTGGQKSTPVTIGVAPHISIRELANGHLKSHVAAANGFKGRLVKLQQRRANGAWRTLVQKRLNSRSDVVFQTPLRASTIRVAMSVNQAGAGYLGSTSYTLRYRPPVVTLSAPALEVRYGNALVLTGRVADRTAGLKVGIFAWKYGRSAPGRVATVTTGPSGSWSYRARPSLQTTYFARFGSMTSTRLTIGVAPAITIGELANGSVVARVAASRPFTGRKVELQRLTAGGLWQTMVQKPLNRFSTATFAPKLSASKLRIAISVNQAGLGFLGAASKTLVFRGT
jgi:hypothetical protein